MKIILLSQLFYDEYSNCPEILSKPTRPYACLSMNIDGVQYAIPFRHHINHPYAFITVNDAGLDYSKAVVISDQKYISSESAEVDSKEWAAVRKNENKIFAEFRSYLNSYKKAAKNPGIKRNADLIRYSALQYFIL